MVTTYKKYFVYLNEKIINFDYAGVSSGNLPMVIIIIFKKKLNVLIQIIIKIPEKISFFSTKKKELKKLRLSSRNFVKKIN